MYFHNHLHTVNVSHIVDESGVTVYLHRFSRGVLSLQLEHLDLKQFWKPHPRLLMTLSHLGNGNCESSNRG